MNLKENIDWKSVVLGTLLSALIVILASNTSDWIFIFASVGLIYVGFKSKNIRQGFVLGTIAAIPLIGLAFNGTLGTFTGFFATTIGKIILIIMILLVGGLIGFIGALTKKDREKAKSNYEQKVGKNKKKK